METVMKADIFFVVSTTGFVLLAIIGSVALLYLIRLLKSVGRIAKKLEGDIDSLGAEAKALVTDLRESFLFRLLFGRGGKGRSQKR